MPRLRSIRTRLTLLVFAITLAAVGFVYVYVAPSLEAHLARAEAREPRRRRARALLATRSSRRATVADRALRDGRRAGRATAPARA